MLAFAFRSYRRFRRLGRGENGAVTVEFVLAFPLLVAALVFAAEYGRVIQVNTALEKAVDDATLFLAKSPVSDGSNSFTPSQIATARQIIVTRLRLNWQEEADSFNIQTAIGPNIATGNGLAGTFRQISVTASMQIEMPMLAFLSIWNGATPDTDYDAPTSLTITAQSQARHLGV